MERPKRKSTRSYGDIMKSDWSDESLNWLEDQLQIAMVQRLRQLESEGYNFTFAASLEGVKLSKSQAGKAKLMGMVSGEPDLRIYFPNRKLLLVELKTKTGRTSKNQDDRIAKLNGLGYDAFVFHARSPQHAADTIEKIVLDECDKIL